MSFREHLLIQFGGLLGVNEEWSCNLRMQIGNPEPGQITPGSLAYNARENWIQANIEDIHGDIAAWHNGAANRNSAAAQLNYVKVNQIGPDGRYLNLEETHVFGATPGPRGNAASGDFSASLCVSLWTDAQRGRASRGRFYPPTGQVTYEDDGSVNATTVTAVLTSAQTLLDNLNNSPGIDTQNPRIVVASNLGEPGPMRDVTQVAVGEILDKQSRRRRSLVENYQARPVTITA